MLCAKFGWNWPIGFWRIRFFNFIHVFSLFRNYPPLENGGDVHLNKLESRSSKDALHQVWLMLAQWFWRRRFLNFINVISLFRNYLLLEKGGPLHLTKPESHHPRMHCPKFGWNWSCGSVEQDENVKCLRQRRRSEKLPWAFG